MFKVPFFRLQQGILIHIVRLKMDLFLPFRFRLKSLVWYAEFLDYSTHTYVTLSKSLVIEVVAKPVTKMCL